MKTHVYLITLANGKAYVGVTSNLRRRKNEHLKRDSLVSRAIRKHGISSFDVLHSCESFEDALNLEREEILARKTQHPLGYNVTEGGWGSSGAPAPPHVIEARRIRMKETNDSMTPEQRKANSQKGSAKSAAAWTDERREAHSQRMREQHAARKAAGLSAPIAKAIEAARSSWTPERREKQKEAMKKALGGGWSDARRAAYQRRKTGAMLGIEMEDVDASGL